jgi:3-deoxy-D-manno-octulosonate 8-phosphate phosphatase (KDO 8-P phosphatase)
MINDLKQIQAFFRGQFLVSPEILLAKLVKVKAFVFDWDGVFNNGAKDENGSSPFSEIDAMGINMLRFNHYLRTERVPVTIIISGEKNKAAFTLAKREHFNAAYYNIRHKKDALLHVCAAHNIEPHEVAFFFDDILDLSMAELCGLRIMVGRACNPLLLDTVVRNNLADYLTFADGGKHAVREATELLKGLSGSYDDTVMHRIRFSEQYQQYLQTRNIPEPEFYTVTGNEITEKAPQ